MSRNKKSVRIFLNMLPVLIMIGLIPFISIDPFLALSYLIVIAVALLIKYDKGDLAVLVFGLVTMTIFEYLFVSTGVETFQRDSLFGLMPLWLPLLWGYGFIAIRRGAEIIVN